MTLYETIISASDLEAGVLAQLQLWLPSYLAEVDLQHGATVGTLPAPRAYVVSSEHEKMPEDQTPAILVRSPGTLSAPEAEGDGTYSARFALDVGIHLSAHGGPHALRLARLYVSALRALLVQQQLLDTIDARLVVRRVDWLGERYGELDSIDDRTICTATTVLVYELANVVSRAAGPLAPAGLPVTSPDWPIAQSAEVVVTKEAISP